jgi:hypothetical protein
MMTHYVTPKKMKCKNMVQNVKVKGKVVPVLSAEHHAMEAYWGSGGTAPLIL